MWLLYGLTWLSATWLTHSLPYVLPWLWLLLSALICLAAGYRLIGWRQTICLCSAITLFAASWTTWRIELRLADQLASHLIRQDVEVRGVIDSLPNIYENRQSFVLRTLAPPSGIPKYLRLNWYENKIPVRSGQVWQFTVRLLPRRGALNPHTFDYAFWLFAQNIGASGYVRTANLITPAQTWHINRLRDWLRHRLDLVLQARPAAGIIKALSLGDRSALSVRDKQIFQQTNTYHLVSISGLHIAFVVWLFTSMVRIIGQFLGHLLRLRPLDVWALGLGCTAAGFYMLLAGSKLPTQRAFIMVTLIACALVYGRQIDRRLVLLGAALVVNIVDPWALLSASFWLSFLAVAILALVTVSNTGTTRGRIITYITQWWSAQWALTLALTPLLLAIFFQWSLISPIANFIAIPVVCFVLVPLAILALLTAQPQLVHLAEYVTLLLRDCLAALASWPYATFHWPAPSLIVLILGHRRRDDLVAFTRLAVAAFSVYFVLTANFLSSA